MLEIIRDKDKNIIAACEYYVVDEKGNWDQKGEFIWVNQLDYSGSVNGHGFGLVKELVKRITKKVPWCKAGYFKREKYNGRVRLYSRRMWERLIKEE